MIMGFAFLLREKYTEQKLRLLWLIDWRGDKDIDFKVLLRN